MAAGGHFGWPIAFLAIWYGRQRPFWKSDLRQKQEGFFHYVLSMAMPNMKLIGEFVTQLEMPQVFWALVYKMAARGHFVFPIDDKNHRVFVIWDLDGYGEYEFNRCICDKVMACTSVCVRQRRRRRRRRNQNIISPKFSNFGDIIICLCSSSAAPMLVILQEENSSYEKILSCRQRIPMGQLFHRINPWEWPIFWSGLNNDTICCYEE